ncbi:hypothetical protein BS47DRAFT_482404 [Hydnum rufescens UP504]|uniref:Uncharacterized protein n=1 Tax=Hydnum rufescens UP504 TaxID=1448309 RepID=A0A9P6AHF8_9AGAM|nr:hypothetical protein BS47DRAFT_482404 [Hydnum rufescens UP504]
MHNSFKGEHVDRFRMSLCGTLVVRDEPGNPLPTLGPMIRSASPHKIHWQSGKLLRLLTIKAAVCMAAPWAVLLVGKYDSGSF